jgi:hypothetical protein
VRAYIHPERVPGRGQASVRVLGAQTTCARGCACTRAYVRARARARVFVRVFVRVLRACVRVRVCGLLLVCILRAAVGSSFGGERVGRLFVLCHVDGRRAAGSDLWRRRRFVFVCVLLWCGMFCFSPSLSVTLQVCRKVAQLDWRVVNNYVCVRRVCLCAIASRCCYLVARRVVKLLVFWWRHVLHNATASIHRAPMQFTLGGAPRGHGGDSKYYSFFVKYFVIIQTFYNYELIFIITLANICFPLC